MVASVFQQLIVNSLATMGPVEIQEKDMEREKKKKKAVPGS